LERQKKKGVNLISSVHKPSDISSVDRMEKDGNTLSSSTEGL
jgi:hypothetical protein